MASPLQMLYRDIVMDLVNRKINDDSTFEEKFDTFLSMVEKNSNYYKSLHDVTQKLASVANNLSYPDDLTEEKANNLYASVIHTSMGSTLRKAASSMYQYARDGKIFDCYRLMYIQMEILFAYLDRTRNFAEWAKNRNESDKPPKYAYKVDNNGVGVNSKPFVLNDYFKEESGLMVDIIPVNVIDMVKNMRNYASHGYHEDETVRLRLTIRNAREQLEDYLNKWCVFLKFLASLTL